MAGVHPHRAEAVRRAAVAPFATAWDDAAKGRFRGAYASRVLAAASRRRELSWCAVLKSAHRSSFERLRKCVSAGRRNQHAGRVCSPEVTCAAPRIGALALFCADEAELRRQARSQAGAWEREPNLALRWSCLISFHNRHRSGTRPQVARGECRDRATAGANGARGDGFGGCRVRRDGHGSRKSR